MVIDLELRNMSNVENSINLAVTDLERRKSDYEGIARKLHKVHSTTSNLSDCNIYLKKKNMQLQSKIDKLTSFKNKISTFSDHSKAADRRVATYVTDESDTFYKTVCIKTGWAAGQEYIKRATKKAWKVITDFYEKHKYVINVIVDITLLAAAFVSLVAAMPTGVVPLFFAAFTFMQALSDTKASFDALGYHLAGDDEKAGIVAERGLRDDLQLFGGVLDSVIEKVTGAETEFFRNLAGFAYDVTSLASFGYGLYKIGKSFFKTFKNGNFRKAKLQGVKTLLGLDLAPGESKESYKAIAENLRFIKNGKQAYTLVKVCKHVKNIKTTYEIADSIYEGTFLTDGIKIVKDIKKAWENLTNAYRCAEKGKFNQYAFVPTV